MSCTPIIPVRLHLRKEKPASLCLRGAETQQRVQGQKLGELHFGSNFGTGLRCRISLPPAPHFPHLKTSESHVSLRTLGFTEKSAMDRGGYFNAGDIKRQRPKIRRWKTHRAKKLYF